MLLILTATFLEQHFLTDNYLTPGTPSTGYLQVKKDQVSAMSGGLNSDGAEFKAEGASPIR